MIDKTITNRKEYKYVIRNHDLLPGIRDFLQSSELELDEYSIGKPNFEYPVHSIYLDSEDFILAEKNSNFKNRFKLRMRYYKEGPNESLFFEIKSRVDNVISKERAGVINSAVALRILAGIFPSSSEYLMKNLKNDFAIGHFIDYMMAYHARPRVHVAYKRAAWENQELGLRATLDANVSCELNEGPCFTTNMSDMLPVWEHTVLELKFTDKFTDKHALIFQNLVREFNLCREAGPKYRDSVRLLTGRCEESDRIIPVSDSVLREHIAVRKFFPRQVNNYKILDAENMTGCAMIK